jgi:TrmH family RNA methyltransferase
MTVPYWGKPLDALCDPSFVVVVEGGEKPGNVGAILRTADAAGVDALILCGAGTDMYNPNAIRASLGAIFSVDVVQAETTAVIQWLQQNKFKTIAATPAAEDVYYNVEMGGKTAVVMGSESDGLTDEWLAAADVQVVIPMHGIVDSLNLSVSTALLLYEVVRQRG